MESWTAGLESVLAFDTLAMTLLGVMVGIVVGAIPGFSATMGVAVVVPFTFAMDPLPGLMMLVGLTGSAMYSGAIPAVLINLPGTPGAAATTIDGHALARQGRAGQALTISLVASVVGGVIGAILLGLFAPVMAEFALSFGPAELFMLCIFALTAVVSVSRGAMLRGMISALLGLGISTVGLDPIQAYARFSFGSTNMTSGFAAIPVIIGIFGVAEGLRQYESVRSGGAENGGTPGKFRLKLSAWRRLTLPTVGSSFLGFVIGVMPGVGSTIASFVAYNETRRLSRDKSKFGKGDERGLAAPEAANNGAIVGALAPMLTLGIPGDAATAILIGALTVHGLTPGPGLFSSEPELVYGLFVGLILVYVMVLIVGSLGVRAWCQIIRVPPRLLWPVVLIMCVVGSFALRGNPFDVLVMSVFGVLGYFLVKVGYPLIPLVIGLILSPVAERGLRRAMILNHGSFDWVLDPIPFVLLVFSLTALVAPWLGRRLRPRAKTEVE